MRIIKEHEERKNEILEVAEQLFARNGYDNTSIHQILEKVGIAKGTFYYYFKSKEEVMNSIIDKYNEMIKNEASLIANNSELKVEERLLQTLLSIQRKDQTELAILKEIHRPQNALMNQKMLVAMIEGMTPIFASIVEAGVKEGVFQTEYPVEAVEMILIYVNIMFDSGIIEISMNDMPRKATALITNIECLLGVEKGSLCYMLQLFH